MRKRRQPYRAPDGKDWRDPKMTVTRNVLRNGVWRLEEWTPDYNQAYMRFMYSENMMPLWPLDPSYDWRRK